MQLMTHMRKRIRVRVFGLFELRSLLRSCFDVMDKNQSFFSSSSIEMGKEAVAVKNTTKIPEKED